MPFKRRKSNTKKPIATKIKQKTIRPAKNSVRRVAGKATQKVLAVAGIAGVEKPVAKKTALVLPVAGNVARFSIAPPENLPVEYFESKKPAVPILPEFAPETGLARAEDIVPSTSLLSAMRTYGTLVTPPEAAVGDAPPGSADILLSAHEMDEYGLVDAEPKPEVKACQRWWKFCLSPRQSFWTGTLFGFAAMGLLTASLWVLVANNAVQAALK